MSTTTTVAHVLAGRSIELAAVAVGAAAGFAAGGVEAAAIGATTGFFAAKSVESLRLALA